MLIHVPEDPEAAASARAAIVADGRLSFGAMGLLMVILDHAPEWRISVPTLSRWAQDQRGGRGEGVGLCGELIRELVANGYVSFNRPNGIDGATVGGTEVHAVPLPMPGDKKPQVVYVIGRPGWRIAKIGTTSNLRARLRTIQTGSPVRLEVLWSCPGGRRLESWLHEGLAGWRLTGEWFDFEEFDPALVVKDGVRKARMFGVE
jgi:hypothetical protein